MYKIDRTVFMTALRSAIELGYVPPQQLSEKDIEGAYMEIGTWYDGELSPAEICFLAIVGLCMNSEATCEIYLN
jgi:hypothetical protein